MKVAVSIPDPLFARADALAKRMNVSRSRMFAQALDAYVEEHSAQTLTEAANELADMLAADPEAQAEVNAILRAGARTVLKYTEW